MPENPTSQNTYLRVLQANVNRSAVAQLALLNTTDPGKYEILALQEPYLDSNQLTRATPYWVVLYPSPYNTNRSLTRAVLLVNREIFHQVTQISYNSHDVVAVNIQSPIGLISLFNFYLDGEHSRALGILEEVLSRERENQRNCWDNYYQQRRDLHIRLQNRA